jgi:hypothetical protein
VIYGLISHISIGGTQEKLFDPKYWKSLRTTYRGTTLYPICQQQSTMKWGIVSANWYSGINNFRIVEHGLLLTNYKINQLYLTSFDAYAGTTEPGQ